MIYNYILYPAIGIILLLILSSCTVDRSIKVVDNFIPQNYMGKWYEIARLPNHFQKGLSNVYANYSINKDGTIKVENIGTNTPYNYGIINSNKYFDFGKKVGIYPYAITEGKWAREIIDFCKQEQIEIDFSELGFFN